MTQPDGYMPPPAYNYDSLAVLAATTQEEWEDQLYGQTASPFENFLSAFFGGLNSGKPFLTALFEAWLQITFGVSTEWPTIDDVLADANDWFARQWANFLALLGIDVNVPTDEFDPSLGWFGGGSAQGGNILDLIVNAWRGLGLTGWTIADAHQSQIDAAAAMAANAAAINDLRARIDASNLGGVFAQVDFSTLPDSIALPAEWTPQNLTGPGFGTFGVSSGRAKITDPGTANRKFRTVYNPQETLTDAQVIVGIWTSSPGIDVFSRSFYRLRGRANAAGVSDVYAELAVDRITLGCTVSGVDTVFKVVGDSGTGTFRFHTNTGYYFIVGTAGGTRSYEVREGRIDGPIVISHTESGTTSQVGALYRRSGLGADWSATPFAYQEAGSLLYFAVADNTNTAVIGSTFRAFRTATTPTDAAAGNNTFPANWYSTTERMSPDMTYTPSTNTLTVHDEDTYYVTVSQLVAVGGVLTVLWSPILYQNGTPVRRGTTTYYPAGSTWQVVFAATFEVYCEANDTLTPGHWASLTTIGPLTADTAGTSTYWSVSRGRPIAT